MALFFTLSILQFFSTYHSFFESHLRYACQVQAQSENTATRRVLVLLKIVLRLLLSSSSITSSNLNSLKILTLFDVVKLLNIIFIQQFLNSSLPFYFLSALVFKRITHILSYPQSKHRSNQAFQSEHINIMFEITTLQGYKAMSQRSFFHAMFFSDNLAALPLVYVKDFIDQYTNHYSFHGSPSYLIQCNILKLQFSSGEITNNAHKFLFSEKKMRIQ